MVSRSDRRCFSEALFWEAATRHGGGARLHPHPRPIDFAAGRWDGDRACRATFAISIAGGIVVLQAGSYPDALIGWLTSEDGILRNPGNKIVAMLSRLFRQAPAPRSVPQGVRGDRLVQRIGEVTAEREGKRPSPLLGMLAAHPPEYLRHRRALRPLSGTGAPVRPPCRVFICSLRFSGWIFVLGRSSRRVRRGRFDFVALFAILAVLVLSLISSVHRSFLPFFPAALRSDLAAWPGVRGCPAVILTPGMIRRHIRLKTVDRPTA
jgi:hypothetical protein